RAEEYINRVKGERKRKEEAREQLKTKKLEGVREVKKATPEKVFKEEYKSGTEVERNVIDSYEAFKDQWIGKKDLKYSGPHKWDSVLR
ncbi:MAG: hypothetical protein SV775_19765, partial [Thermodesulfobacteriota bacterium]|nr:hypothetical protein [Thermodesulfobacteriota bacterium]